MHDDYCKIFVDYDGARRDLVEILCLICSGSPIGRATVCSDGYEIDVEDNEDFDSLKKLNPVDGFLHYRYYLDIEPCSSYSRPAYIESLSHLIVNFRRMGIAVVPACNFEDILPKI